MTIVIPLQEIRRRPDVRATSWI